MIRQQRTNKLTIPLIYLALALATLIAYQQVGRNDFVYDDIEYITDNPHVKNGISRESFFWAFKTSYAGYWHPVTWLSHMLDCELFGPKPYYHHLVNVFLHIVNTLLLFWVLKGMTGAVWRSAFVAAVFALHPVHVESVAWVAERKDLLCGFFWILTIAAYVRYARRPSVGRYLLVMLGFGMGLLSKPMMVTFPFVLLLLDYWPLRRFHRAGQAESEVAPSFDSADACYQKSTPWRLIWEKVPLFILMLASAAVTLITTQQNRAIATLKGVPVDMRIANAVISYISYISKMIYPSGLAALYPYTYERFLSWQPIVSTIMLVVLTVSIIYLARQGRPYLLTGWLWYLGTLVPVVGFVQAGAQSMADRYTYLPSIGFLIIVAWGMSELLSKKRHLKAGLSISACIVIVVLTICTRVQVQYWRDNVTLFGRAFELTSNNFLMLSNMGNGFAACGKYDGAIICYNEALRFDPNNPSVHYNMANCFVEQGDFNEAISNYQQAIKSRPNFFEAHINLGAVLLKQNKLDEANNHFQKAMQIDANNPILYHSMGNLCAAKGEFSEAIGHYNQAIKIEPDFALSLNSLARIYATNPNKELQDAGPAIKLAQRAAKITKYRNAIVLDTLAAAYASAGRFSEAIETAKKGIQAAESAQKNKLIEQIQSHFQLYKSSKPYIEPLPKGRQEMDEPNDTAAN